MGMAVEAIAAMVESWSCLAAWLEYEQGLDRGRAEWDALARNRRLTRLTDRYSIADVLCALREAEAGKPERLKGMMR